MTLAKKPGKVPSEEPLSPTRRGAPISHERSIFRAVAMEQYIRNQERVELPKTVSPGAFIYLWIIAGLVTIVGMVLVFWPWVEPFVMGTL